MKADRADLERLKGEVIGLQNDRPDTKGGNAELERLRAEVNTLRSEIAELRKMIKNDQCRVQQEDWSLRQQEDALWVHPSRYKPILGRSVRLGDVRTGRWYWPWLVPSSEFVRIPLAKYGWLWFKLKIRH